jgi:transcriptional regulator with AAA-type ATPase domain
MKSNGLICGNDSNEEFEELRALIVRCRGNQRAMAIDLGASTDQVKKKLKEHGLHEVCVQEALDSKLRFRLPID